ncbi:GntR family transcriptional regulator [Nonomuraea jiangxiensis]|uniref:GntR family transcriptional regulator n=1 Tax=Nonomuraea jiangxiensis TaxID=633440 RepID=A0A1G9RBR6_9ACTN|nr:GntR family transcriptional regulator [Nonomuraea jiangxiensis]SDM20749.1 GntR family transcriptional regulator [Nonomuraea jiangxiensis]
MTRQRLDRESFVPMYYQLQQALIQDMDAGMHRPGDRLPSESELCDSYGVSRTVVRQALRELEISGRIVRRKGQGSFVALPKTSELLVQSLTGLHEDVTSRGGTMRSDVRRLERVPATPEVAAELGIAPGDPVIVLDRLRFVNEVPWVTVVTYLPYALCPRLLEEDLTQQSLYALLEDGYGVEISWGRRRVEAVPAPAAVARALEIRRGSPILLLSSTSYAPDGRPVEYFVASHRGDLSRFEVRLERRKGAPYNPLLTLQSADT